MNPFYGFDSSYVVAAPAMMMTVESQQYPPQQQLSPYYSSAGSIGPGMMMTTTPPHHMPQQQQQQQQQLVPAVSGAVSHWTFSAGGAPPLPPTFQSLSQYNNYSHTAPSSVSRSGQQKKRCLLCYEGNGVYGDVCKGKIARNRCSFFIQENYKIKRRLCGTCGDKDCDGGTSNPRLCRKNGGVSVRHFDLLHHLCPGKTSDGEEMGLKLPQPTPLEALLNMHNIQEREKNGTQCGWRFESDQRGEKRIIRVLCDGQTKFTAEDKKNIAICRSFDEVVLIISGAASNFLGEVTGKRGPSMVEKIRQDFRDSKHLTLNDEDNSDSKIRILSKDDNGNLSSELYSEVKISFEVFLNHLDGTKEININENACLVSTRNFFVISLLLTILAYYLV